MKLVRFQIQAREELERDSDGRIHLVVNIIDARANSV